MFLLTLNHIVVLCLLRITRSSSRLGIISWFKIQIGFIFGLEIKTLGRLILHMERKEKESVRLEALGQIKSVYLHIVIVFL